MAWEAPRTWVAEEVISAAIMNTALRDNLLVLSTHAHSGAAGMGDDELSGVDSIAFDDLAASPDAAGELQRNGANLEWYGAAVVAITQADAAVGTASPRTLGAGAQQAAVGNHTHTPSNVQTQGDVSAYSTTLVSVGTVETDIRSVAITPGAANRFLDFVAGGYGNIDTARTCTLRLYYDAVEKASLAIATPGAVIQGWMLGSFHENPTVAAHTVKVTGQMDSGAANVIGRLVVREIKV